MSMAGAPTTLLDGIARKPSKLGAITFGTALAGGVAYAAWHLAGDLSGIRTSSWFEFVLLGIALSIALGFEFVNGFHDTANAVATVIYTNSLEPRLAVVWSGFWNFIGVLTSGGAVAFGIVSLLPVELILKVGTQAGFAMVFALLVAAILWNLGTWYFGIPNSSSHTLIGSILGVGLMNQWTSVRHSATSGVDWGQALEVGESLVFSPIVGFLCSALLLLLLKRFVPNPKLYTEPRGTEPPPFWIRGLLMLTCTGVSFAHGSNDGQKGMGLIMLILVGTVPAAYSLNHAVGYREVRTFLETSDSMDRVLGRYTASGATAGANPRPTLEQFISSETLRPEVMPALRVLVDNIKQQVAIYKTLSLIPTQVSGNVRNDMYLAGETLRVCEKRKTPAFSDDDRAVIARYQQEIDRATKFIPTWVKVAVALALGMGTMVGWRRIVITVGERIGKQHLTYAQGAVSELVAMGTILAADRFGVPVSTTHVLTSGVAGAMAANHSGLQWPTIRNVIMAWVLTLPASIVLAAGLYWIFRRLLA
jgi:PiT family inorganic phosphate transporter